MLDTPNKIDIANFLEHLQNKGILTKQKKHRLQNSIQNTDHPIDIVITELGFLPEVKLAECIAKFKNLTFQVNTKSFKYDFEFPELPFDFLEENAIVPLKQLNDTLHLLMANPFDEATIEIVSYYTDLQIQPVVSTRSKILELLLFNKRVDNDLGLESITESLNSTVEIDLDRLQNVAREAPVVKLVAKIIQQAIDANSTDIHIEPWEDLIQVRFRQDGILITSETAPKSLQAGLVTRIKILSGLNISERRLPQDGRMRLSIRGQEIDFRVSVMPSVHGETLVLRILERSANLIKLIDLGFDPKAEKQLARLLQSSNGIFLVTGPTGSGKTTTLYSLINMLNAGDKKIFTVEDPVEYRLEGITQLQINPAIDLDFPQALRSVLRQDPDIILIGEIRDVETARIAIQAALTGHLVLSTLHTNSAIGAVTRLRDMGIDDYLIGATLKGVLGQRLVRKLTHQHKDKTEKQYMGRTVLYEIAETNEKISKAISASANQTEIEMIVQQDGMLPINKYAEKLISKGITSKEEIARVIQFGAK